MRISSNYLGLYFLSAIVYILSPFWGMLLSVFIIYYYRLKEKGVLWFSFLIALFWGLLAYTQNCKSMETDSIRYYQMFAGIIRNVHSLQDLLILLNEELLTFVFVPVTTVLVYITNNVQVLSLFWVTVSYYICFISILMVTLKKMDVKNFIKKRGF